MFYFFHVVRLLIPVQCGEYFLLVLGIIHLMSHVAYVMFDLRQRGHLFVEVLLK